MRKKNTFFLRFFYWMSTVWNQIENFTFHLWCEDQNPLATTPKKRIRDLYTGEERVVSESHRFQGLQLS